MAKVLKLQLQHHSLNEYSGLVSFRIDWFDVLAVQRTLKSKTLDTDFLIAPETRSLKSKCRQIGFY